MASDRPRDYEVGYKKPPVAGRFKKGNNANPRGRPRVPKSLATMLERALDTPVVVVENGARRKLSMRAMVIAQLVDRSARADLRATKILLDLLHKIECGAAPATAGADPPADDVEIKEQLRAKLMRLALAQAEVPSDMDPPKSEDGADPARKETDR